MRPEKWLNSREQLYIPSQNRCAFCDSDLDLIDGLAGPLRFCSRAHELAYQMIESQSRPQRTAACRCGAPQRRVA